MLAKISKCWQKFFGNLEMLLKSLGNFGKKFREIFKIKI